MQNPANNDEVGKDFVIDNMFSDSARAKPSSYCLAAYPDFWKVTDLFKRVIERSLIDIHLLLAPNGQAIKQNFLEIERGAG